MAVLALCNHKGGTGKTTSAIHFGAALGLCGYRTLVIDLDPQSFLSRMLGIREPPVEESSWALFQHDRTLRDIACVSMHGFDVLPASGLLTKKMRQLTRPTDVLWVKETLAGDSIYDVVVLDTAAAVTVYSLNALVAANQVVIPVTPEYQPIVGAEQTFRTISTVRAKLNPGLDSCYFLLTQADGRKRAHHMYRRYLRAQYGSQVLRQVIRTSASLATSHADGKTVFEHDPYSRGARDYANATDEIIPILGLRRDAP